MRLLALLSLGLLACQAVVPPPAPPIPQTPIVITRIARAQFDQPTGLFTMAVGQRSLVRRLMQIDAAGNVTEVALFDADGHAVTAQVNRLYQVDRDTVLIEYGATADTGLEHRSALLSLKDGAATALPDLDIALPMLRGGTIFGSAFSTLETPRRLVAIDVASGAETLLDGAGRLRMAAYDGWPNAACLADDAGHVAWVAAREGSPYADHIAVRAPDGSVTSAGLAALPPDDEWLHVTEDHRIAFMFAGGAYYDFVINDPFDSGDSIDTTGDGRWLVRYDLAGGLTSSRVQAGTAGAGLVATTDATLYTQKRHAVFADGVYTITLPENGAPVVTFTLKATELTIEQRAGVTRVSGDFLYFLSTTTGAVTRRELFGNGAAQAIGYAGNGWWLVAGHAIFADEAGIYQVSDIIEL